MGLKAIKTKILYISLYLILLFSFGNLQALTFGNATDACTTSQALDLNNSYELMAQFTASGSSVTHLGAFGPSGNDEGAKLCIVADDGSNAPASSGSSCTAIGDWGSTGAGFKTVNLAISGGFSVTAGQKYWISIKTEGSDDYLCHDNAAGGNLNKYGTGATWGSGGDGFTAVDSSSLLTYSAGDVGLYATYTSTDTTSPTIDSVNSTKAAGSYKAGEVIDINVNFDEAVDVTGTPYLTVETGSTDRNVSYYSGSGSTTIVFRYTVQAGDTSSDLDYKATGSLALNGGTIKDDAATPNNATLTLASPGASGSLAANEAFVIDTTAPTDQNTVFASAATVAGGGSVTIVSTAASDLKAWIAPASTTSFSAGSTMTVASAYNSTSMSAPTTTGTYYIYVLDAAGNYSSASSAALTVDATNPTLSSSTPSDGVTSVAIDQSIVLNFGEAVVGDSGNITIIDTSASSTFATFACSSLSSSTQHTLNPSSDLTNSKAYHVLVPASCFNDASGNSYAGLTSAGALNFVTVAADSTAPTLSSSSPSDGATGVEIDANIVLTFSESVDAESGNIVIYNSGGTAVETIAVTDSEVSGTGSDTITINPSSDLENGTTYYVQIAATGFDDAASNSYAGITNTTDLNFTTITLEAFDQTTRGLIDSQTIIATNNIRESIQSVNSRLDLIRNLENNLSRQGIQVAFDISMNESVNKMMTLIGTTLAQEEENLFENNWAIWTEGTITYGRVGAQGGILGQEVRSDSLTIGVDKKLPDDRIIGIALHGSWKSSEIGSTAEVDNTIVSITSYGSQKISEDTFVDASLGFSQMHIDTDRDVTGGKNAGDRDGQQIYGSASYTMKPDVNLQKNINVNYFSRLDLGYTFLDNYTESGLGTTSLSYAEDHITNGSLSIGSKINKTYINDKGLFVPFANVELGGSIVRNGISEAYYNSNPSTISNYKSSADGTNIHTNLGLGFKANLNNSWNMDLKLNQYNNNNNESAQSLSAMFNVHF